MINEVEPIRNDELKEIISKLHTNYDKETEAEFFESIKEASFIAPVEIQIDDELENNISPDGTLTLDKDTPINFMLIRSEDGKNFLPAFTGEEEFGKDEIKGHAIVIRLENYIEIIKTNPNDIQGIALNPFGEAIVIPKERII